MIGKLPIFISPGMPFVFIIPTRKVGKHVHATHTHHPLYGTTTPSSHRLSSQKIELGKVEQIRAFVEMLSSVNRE